MKTLSKNNQRMFSMLLAILLLLQAFALPSFADSDIQKPPAKWAQESIRMGQIYGFLDASMLSGFERPLIMAEMTALGMKLSEQLGMTAEEADLPIVFSAYATEMKPAILTAGMGDAATRLDVAVMLFHLLSNLTPVESQSDPALMGESTWSDLSRDEREAVSFCLSTELMKGRGKGLALNQPVTFQEMAVFLNRAYEWVAYSKEQDSIGALWKAQHGENTLWLLGSIQMGDAALYPLSKSILTAYDQSDALVVEADILNNSEGIQYMLKNGVYNDGTTLKQVLTKKTFALFKDLMDTSGIPETVYGGMRPWYAASLALALTAGESSLDAGLGIDMYFMARANGEKPVWEIEGLEFQTDLFNSFSPALQEAYLLSILAVEEETTTGDALVYMLDLWKAGDVEALNDMVNGSEAATPALQEFNHKLIVERNRRMAEQAELWLNSEEPVTLFVVLGAANMFGETGIATVLEENGYQVKRVLR